MSNDARADLAVVRAERKAGAERANFAQAIWGWHPSSVVPFGAWQRRRCRFGCRAGTPAVERSRSWRNRIPQGCWRSHACDYRPRRSPGSVSLGSKGIWLARFAALATARSGTWGGICTSPPCSPGPPPGPSAPLRSAYDAESDVSAPRIVAEARLRLKAPSGSRGRQATAGAVALFIFHLSNPMPRAPPGETACSSPS